MKIDRLKPDSDVLRKRDDDLRRLLAQPRVEHERVCPDCTLPCPGSGSTTCTCACAPDCPHAPAQMTSDPNFPIETAIAPLVYALFSLKLCQPCWSCEGHADAEGKVTRIPRVWFYCRSLVYPKLIDRYLTYLKFKRRLNYPWHLCITHFEDEGADTAFSMEPDLSYVDQPELNLLQRDIGPIANGLSAYLKTEARKNLGMGS